MHLSQQTLLLGMRPMPQQARITRRTAHKQQVAVLQRRPLRPVLRPPKLAYRPLRQERRPRKAGEASNSASSAAAAQTAAEAARDSALSALDSFDDRYLGVKSSDPSLDNDGNALVSGALYFSSTTTTMKVYDGSNWLNAYASLSGALIANNNLSDLNNAGTARTNLGLAAVAASGAYSDLTGTPNLSSYITNNVSGDFTVDSGTLFVDAATNRVGINLGSGVSPTVPLNVAGTVRFQSTSSAGQMLEFTNYSSYF